MYFVHLGCFSSFLIKHNVTVNTRRAKQCILIIQTQGVWISLAYKFARPLLDTVSLSSRKARSVEAPSRHLGVPFHHNLVNKVLLPFTIWKFSRQKLAQCYFNWYSVLLIQVEYFPLSFMVELFLRLCIPCSYPLFFLLVFIFLLKC